MCIWNLNAPVMANPKDGQGHKDAMTNSIFFKMGQCQGQKGSNRKILITWNIHLKYHNASIHRWKVVSKAKFSKSRLNSKVKVTG